VLNGSEQPNEITTPHELKSQSANFYSEQQTAAPSTLAFDRNLPKFVFCCDNSSSYFDRDKGTFKNRPASAPISFDEMAAKAAAFRRDGSDLDIESERERQ
jgi:hypothetical protein